MRLIMPFSTILLKWTLRFAVQNNFMNIGLCSVTDVQVNKNVWVAGYSRILTEVHKTLICICDQLFNYRKRFFMLCCTCRYLKKIGLHRPKIVFKLTYFKQNYLPKISRQQHVITMHLLYCVSTSLTIFHHPDNTKDTRFLNVPSLLKLFLRCYDIFSHGDTHLKLVRIQTSRSHRFSFSEKARVSLDVIIEKVD